MAAATRVAARLGHAAGGLVGGLPVVAGPIVLIYALEQGRGYAAEAAEATVLGIVSLLAFCAVYGALAVRARWWAAVAGGWLAFGVATAVFAQVEIPVPASAALCLAGIAVVAPRLRRAGALPAEVERRSDLLALRLVTTAALVVALTAAAGSVSPRVAGLLAPFPIITAVLAGFTHARAGGAAANELLAGLTRGLVSFVLFFVALAALLPGLGIAGGFAAATCAALACHAVLITAT